MMGHGSGITMSISGRWNVETAAKAAMKKPGNRTNVSMREPIKPLSESSFGRIGMKK